jgi:hypothetical protein
LPLLLLLNVPHIHRAILSASIEPLGVVIDGDAGDIGGVVVESLGSEIGILTSRGWSLVIFQMMIFF